ncbi:MAG: beta-lactamase family protein [Myxococcales bacterium]|nr:beta-lactamase family protein [Myxococcales bacterium]MCB9525119.1 beta-lactamase family protein [Myxococcales bacterium]
MRRNSGLWAAACAVGLWACGSTASEARPDEDLAAGLARLVAKHGVPSLSAVVVADGRVLDLAAAGEADPASGREATVDTLYGLASCSKPFVGLLAAFAVTDGAVELDEDINDVLEWPQPVRHPDHPDTPVTLRQLLTHRGGIAEDTAADYETYPKPDPDQPLGPFLQAFLAQPSGWADHAPGAAEAYSNPGVALAAHVLEVAEGQDLRALSKARLFDPLGMKDTRWFYGDLSAEQKARHAVPVDDGGEPYEIYGFNDYPSGLLRSTARDLGRLLVALTRPGGALPAAVVQAFQSTPMLIEVATGGGLTEYNHSGGEAGVNTYLAYRSDGVAYAWLCNGDLDDDALDALAADLDALLLAQVE